MVDGKKERVLGDNIYIYAYGHSNINVHLLFYSYILIKVI